jgi:hypothetical protein
MIVIFVTSTSVLDKDTKNQDHSTTVTVMCAACVFLGMLMQAISQM